MTDTPNRGIPYVPEGTLDPAAGLNLSLNVIDALLQCAVISMSETGPPITSADGDLYIVASPATGDWTGLEDHLVRYVSEGTFWQSYVPGAQVNFVLNNEDGLFYRYDADISPAGWVLAAGLGEAPIDGILYGRRDGAWEVAGITIQDEDSPPEVVDPAVVLVIGAGLTLTEPMAGVAHITGDAGSFSPDFSNVPVAGDRLIYDGTDWIPDSPKYVLRIFEDFLQVPGAAGDNGWDAVVSGTGAALTGAVVAGHPGVLNMNSGTASAAQAGVVNQLDGAVAATTGFVMGGGVIYFRAKVRFTALPTPTENAALRVGLMDEGSGGPTNGIYLATDATNFGDARIAGANRNGTLTYTSAASFIPTVNVWFDVEFIVNAAGTAIDFYAGGVHLGQSTTNLPTGAAMVAACNIQKIATVGTVASVIQIDYLEVVQFFTAAR